MKQQIKKLNFWLVLAVDLLIICAAHLLAYGIRFDFSLSPHEWRQLLLALPFIIPLKLLVFYQFGLYRGMWRYTGIADLLNISKATLVSAVLVVAGMLFFNRFEGYSRSVFLIDPLLCFLFLSGFRVGLRLYYQRVQGGEHIFDFAGRRQFSRQRKPLLIIGAGDAGEKIMREIHDNRSLPYQVVGFLDDQPGKIGQCIHGVPVWGATIELEHFAERCGAKEILIAIPSAGRDRLSRIVELCRSSGLPFKTLPSLGEMVSGTVSVRNIREVSYRDLLGRPPVELELARIGEVLSDRVVLVSGAGGSIGSELCRQIIRFRPRRLIMLEASEHNLYQIEMELLHEHGFKDYLAVLGKVQDRELLTSLFTQHKPQVVFHAAAYKHVPMVEGNPWEGVYNNIFASKRLMEAAVENGVEYFVLISTDKAVRPTNVMGASKRLSEIIMQSYYRLALNTANKPGAKTRFMAVRFGNVLGSSGSVIPLFKRQIELGGPVTVTHTEMTRYFMSIEDAAQLILQAASMGEGGEIFVLEMGTPVRIADMARDLIRLCGREPDSEIEIKYTGLRPGEKMYEELISEGEGIVPTSHHKIMVLKGEPVDPESLKTPLNKLKLLAKNHDAEGIRQQLKAIVPEYKPQKTEPVLLPSDFSTE